MRRTIARDDAAERRVQAPLYLSPARDNTPRGYSRTLRESAVTQSRVARAEAQLSQGFERRFRDIHTVAQQLQGRDDHFENVGKFLLDLEPDTTLL